MSPAGPAHGATRSTWIAAALVAVCVSLVFAPIFDGEFLNFDDDLNITENHAFRGLGTEQLTWMFTTNWMGPYQPLSWLSLALDHQLWGLGGPAEFPEAPYYHRTNVLLHALAAGAFVFLARSLLRQVRRVRGSAGDPPALVGAVGAALFFGLHPLRVESVAWVTERRDVLSGLFIVLALVVWLRRASTPRSPEHEPSPRRLLGAGAASSAALLAFWSSVDLSGTSALAWRGPGVWGLAAALAALALAARLAAGEDRPGAYFATLAWFLAALLSKGLVVVFPVVLLVLDAWPLGRLVPGRRWACVLEKAPFLALSAAFAQLALWGQAAQAGTVAGLESHTLAERLAQAAYGFARYPLATLFPIGLRPIHELPDALSLAEPRFALAAAGVVLLTFGAWRARQRFPAVGASWLAFGLIVAPVVGLTQSGPQLVADRYTYLSCMPFALLAGGGLCLALRRGGAVARVVLPIAALCLACYGHATWRYTAVWRTSSSLWEYTLALDPDNGAAWLNRATAHARRAQLESDPARRTALYLEVLEQLERGLEVREDPRLYGNIALIRGLLGEHDEALAAAERALDTARADGVLVANYHLLLGTELLAVGRASEALAAFELVLGAQPDHFRALLGAGQALSDLGRHSEAARRFERATELEGASAQAWRRLALAREGAGERSGAIHAWRRVLVLVPGHVGATQHLSDLGAGR